jgi:hypothetical protein
MGRVLSYRSASSSATICFLVWLFSAITLLHAAVVVLHHFVFWGIVGWLLR